MTTATIERERILTENEKHGSGFLDETAGGLWVVQGRTYDSWHLAVICTNRGAAEAYIHEHIAEHPGRTLDDYRLEVWAACEAWPPEEDA